MTQRVGGRAGLIGLIAFLALDVLLVAFALNSTSAPVVGGGTTIGTPGPAVPSSTGAISGPTPATTTPTTATTAAPAASVKVVPLTVGSWPWMRARPSASSRAPVAAGTAGSS
jgi:hypothetical protein